MFSYLRGFALFATVVIVCFTIIACGALRTQVMDDFFRLVEKNNSSMAEGYVDAVWRTYPETVMLLQENNVEKLKNNPESMAKMQRFAQDTVKYFRKMPLLRVNIYNASGSLILSQNIKSGGGLAGQERSPDANFILGQLRGIAVSRQELERPLLNGGKGFILQTLVPITVADQDNAIIRSEGIVELVSDLTGPSDKLTLVQVVGAIDIIGVFLIFLGLLIVMSKRTEAIITKQHEANIELAAAAAQAQAESKDKSQFLANVSHELRTPLNAIIGFSEIIKNNTIDEEADGQKFEDYINDIHASGVHLLSLINDILDYSKAEAGKLELEVAEANASKLLHSCVRLITPRAETAQVYLVEELPKEPLNMVTDSKRFKQIVLNLLSNAVKFTPAGGEVKISAWSDLERDGYIFEVRDTGIGIAPKDISRAMAAFGQVDSTLSRKYDGTGLGLPITKKFVELMGGEFKIESEVDVGTTITFFLPREVVAREGVVVKHIG